MEELLKKREEAGEEARQRAEAAARLRKLILKEVTTQVCGVWILVWIWLRFDLVMDE